MRFCLLFESDGQFNKYNFTKKNVVNLDGFHLSVFDSQHLHFWAPWLDLFVSQKHFFPSWFEPVNAGTGNDWFCGVTVPESSSTTCVCDCCIVM